MPTNLPDKLTTPSTVVCQSPDCDVDTDFCDHPKIDVDKQNMQDDIELLTTFADGAGEGSLPWNSDGKCTPTGVPSFKSLMAWLGLQFTQIYCALQNIYNQICEMLERKRVSFIANGFRSLDEAPDITLNLGNVYRYTLASNGPVYDDSDSAYNEICNPGDRNLNIQLDVVSSPTVYDDDVGEVFVVDELREWDFNTSSWGAWGAWGINDTDWLLTLRTGTATVVKQIAPGACFRFQVRTTITVTQGIAIIDKWAAGYSALCVWEEVSI